MPQTCSICKHPQRLLIESALVRHTPLRRIGEQFRVGYSAVLRHQKHVLTKLSKAREGIELAEGTALLAKVDQVVRDAQRITRAAESKGDLQTALQGLRTITNSLALLGRITGEIQQANSVQFHAHLHASNTAVPQDDGELELAIARSVAEATDNFSPQTISRFKSLLAAVIDAGDGHDSAMMTIEAVSNEAV